MLLSIDGVGAFDHVCRVRIFEELQAHEELRDLLPFITMWYGTASLFYWRDQNGITSEQDDALMPGLFCLAMRRALIAAYRYTKFVTGGRFYLCIFGRYLYYMSA